MTRMSDYDIRLKSKVWAGSPNQCRTFGRTLTECCVLGWNNVFYWTGHWAARKFRSKFVCEHACIVWDGKLRRKTAELRPISNVMMFVFVDTCHVYTRTCMMHTHEAVHAHLQVKDSPPWPASWSQLNTRRTCQKLLTNSLVSHLILNCSLPVSIVDDPDFRQFLHDVDPQFSVPCRQTVTYAILPAMTEGKHNKLQQLQVHFWPGTHNGHLDRSSTACFSGCNRACVRQWDAKVTPFGIQVFWRVTHGPKNCWGIGVCDDWQPNTEQSTVDCNW